MSSAAAAAEEAARIFLEEECAFHLGFLPTEQPNPRTVRLSEYAQCDPQKACALLLSVEAALAETLRWALASEGFNALRRLLQRTIRGGGRIFLSGCGATGRLCLLLESSWREACRSGSIPEEFRDRVHGFMTGGDYAFIRSVESFEDYAAFGVRQVADCRVGPADCLIGVSEGGETASVLGSVRAARAHGARVAFLCNNPHTLLRERIERSRLVLDDPEVLCLELDTGTMALTGSTRMQATTSELLYLGAALEQTAAALSHPPSTPHGSIPALSGTEYVSKFSSLVEALASSGNCRSLGQWVGAESEAYAAGGCVTYYAAGAMLDILTDITERTPTFALPPLSSAYRPEAVRPWTLVKHPFLDTAQTWNFLLGRTPSCLEWTSEDYRRMNASQTLINRPPCINADELFHFYIGNEPAPERQVQEADRGIVVCTALDEGSGGYGQISGAISQTPRDHSGICFCDSLRPCACPEGALTICCPLPPSPLRLWEHLALKMTLNTVSTVVMARIGRTDGNWMTHVQPTNKKLIDRSCRILQTLLNISYPAACRLLFRELQADDRPLAERPSPVQAILRRQKQTNGA